MFKEKKKVGEFSETVVSGTVVYKCDNCGDIQKVLQKERIHSKPTTCRNPFCREKNHFTELKTEKISES